MSVPVLQVRRVPLSIVVIGPAGSGKTTLVANLGEWLEGEVGSRVSYVNLDPAVEVLPYKPDFDARSIVSARDLMVKERLGPNGAIIKSVDILASESNRILEELSKLDCEIMLVDTPGQSELFVFREAGPKLTSTIEKVSRPIGVYLIDPTLGFKGSEAAIAFAMSLIVQLRLGVPTIPVINKADLLDYIPKGTYVIQLDEIIDSLKLEKGILSELTLSLSNLIRSYSPAIRLVSISALNKLGFHELYSIVHEVFCVCGDLT